MYVHSTINMVCKYYTKRSDYLARVVDQKLLDTPEQTCSISVEYLEQEKLSTEVLCRVLLTQLCNPVDTVVQFQLWYIHSHRNRLKPLQTQASGLHTYKTAIILQAISLTKVGNSGQGAHWMDVDVSQLRVVHNVSPIETANLFLDADEPKFVPEMVRTDPPALGPLSGWTSVTTGASKLKRFCSEDSLQQFLSLTVSRIPRAP